jgi:hypothetical protein
LSAPNLKPKKRWSRIALASTAILSGRSIHYVDCDIPLTARLSEFNYVKDDAGKCVLVPGTTPLPDDDSCRDDEDYWYERTAYRKIPYSSCEDGERPDRGPRHLCFGIRAHGALFWWSIILLPFMFTALVAYWYYRRMGLARGYVLRLHDSLTEC